MGDVGGGGASGGAVPVASSTPPNPPHRGEGFNWIVNNGSPPIHAPRPAQGGLDFRRFLRHVARIRGGGAAFSPGFALHGK